MVMELYTMFDVVKQEMGGIMMYKNDNEALRAAQKMLRTLDEKSTLRPEDFKVYKLGTIDTEKMTGESLRPKELILTVEGIK